MTRSSLSDLLGCATDNINFNHPPTNLNPEFKPNEGCGCVGSYNGGAGGGTAECTDCCRPYEPGFQDKKRDPNCCGCDGSYQAPLCDKKVTVPVSKNPCICPPKDDSTCCRDPGLYSANVYHSPSKSQPAKVPCPCEDTYQGGLCNKNPNSSDHFSLGSTCCSNQPDTYELICNKDAQRYKGKGSERGCFFSDDSCPTCQSNNNNNACKPEEKDDCGKQWARWRETHYASTCPEVCREPCQDTCAPEAPVPKMKPKCSSQCCHDEICCTERNYGPVSLPEFKYKVPPIKFPCDS